MNKTIGNIEVLGWCWFTGRDSIGIVYCEDTITKEKKAYIGVGIGVDEQADITHIVEWGTKFPVDQAKILVTNLGFI